MKELQKEIDFTLFKQAGKLKILKNKNSNIWPNIDFESSSNIVVTDNTIVQTNEQREGILVKNSVNITNNESFNVINYLLSDMTIKSVEKRLQFEEKDYSSFLEESKESDNIGYTIEKNNYLEQMLEKDNLNASLEKLTAHLNIKSFENKQWKETTTFLVTFNQSFPRWTNILLKNATPISTEVELSKFKKIMEMFSKRIMNFFNNTLFSNINELESKRKSEQNDKLLEDNKFIDIMKCTTGETLSVIQLDKYRELLLTACENNNHEALNKVIEQHSHIYAKTLNTLFFTREFQSVNGNIIKSILEGNPIENYDSKNSVFNFNDICVRHFQSVSNMNELFSEFISIIHKYKDMKPDAQSMLLSTLDIFHPYITKTLSQEDYAKFVDVLSLINKDLNDKNRNNDLFRQSFKTIIDARPIEGVVVENFSPVIESVSIEILIKNLPEKSQEIIASIYNLHAEILKDIDLLNEMRVKEIENLLVNKLPELLQQFSSFKKEQWNTLEHFNGKKLVEILNDTLDDIHSNLLSAENQITEQKLSNFNISSRYISNFKRPI